MSTGNLYGRQNGGWTLISRDADESHLTNMQKSDHLWEELYFGYLPEDYKLVADLTKYPNLHKTIEEPAEFWRPSSENWRLPLKLHKEYSNQDRKRFIESPSLTIEEEK